ncbi:polysaccharide pyruvyl transferase family protein [Epilithonimonas mollis]|uniref:Exopolysaccharide biosynthesis protein EpsI, predicted pyruvyl transferase n=1 Tax=Epilithonimonas mollis TaxID=216903 RepID=A0A1M6RR30_9FLAO|nr:polysaccharide pyruvyl transferase family protein [Epilithonimonas mollis]SHK34903.1 Exopolysaccharide biosynthesis protein EpsI, predicted pyruvyl transferase [Epilithonimonas mollis]
MTLSSIFSFRFKYNILLFIQKFKGYPFFKRIEISKDRNKAFFFLAADYGNLGDCAITFAQTKFIEENSNYEVIEIPISKTAEGIWFVKEKITKADIVVTVGGGNMGEMYDQIEFLRQLVIKNFPANKIISFPQTFDFSDSSLGKKSLVIAKKIYSRHTNLHLVAREETSYKQMKLEFNHNQIYITPDIVLSLSENLQKKREGVIICMRADEEKRLTPEENSSVIELIKNNFNKYEFYDTHIGNTNLNSKEREYELNKIWKAFSNCKLVITDRLHGMIFCHITNTPALVFQNTNHKVRETYDWIRKNSNIKVVSNFDLNDVESFIKEFQSQRDNYITNCDLDYSPLIKLLN